MTAVTITFAGINFDHANYDERGDLLYLNVGEPRLAARGLETPRATRSTTTKTAG